MSPRPARLQAGMSLVEILVAMTISLILLGGVAQIYLSSKQTYTVQDALARVQENGRFATELLSRELRGAGYLGCNSRNPGTVVNTLNNAATLPYNFALAIIGLDAAAPPDDEIAPSALPGNDIVTLTALEADNIRVVPPFMNNQSAALQVTAGNPLQQFDIVVAGDCRGSSILQISGNNPGTSGTIAHNEGVGTPGNFTSDLGRIYQGDAEVNRVVRRTYFIRTGLNGRPALWRIENSRPGSAPVELVENVERLEIRYGVDTSGNRLADIYQSAAQVTTAGAWPSVVSTRFAMLVASADEVAPTAESRTYALVDTTVPTTDRRVRRVFTSTVALRNRAP